ncbi:MAG TPA: FtsX-like permease family protein, partial [Terriglobales bacterium]|nr:FtsX-like permease family protein [Terriglobales bacterium]
ILAGRGIEAQDTASSQRVVVINETMAKRFFAGKDPVGRQFTIDDPDWLDKPLTIVGVSRDAKVINLRGEITPRFYLPYRQVPDPRMFVLEVRAAGPPAAVVSGVLSQIREADPQLPITFVSTLSDRVSRQAVTERAIAKLSGFFGALALLLACVGLYGVMSYTVAGRTREIGVRMALGARRGDVLELILREAMLLVGAGLAVGIPLSLVSGRVLASFLFGLNSTDPLSLISVLLLLATVAAFAGFIPARRAAKVDPMIALRYE